MANSSRTNFLFGVNLKEMDQSVISCATVIPRPEQTGGVQQRLVLGMFTLYPAYGSVAAGGQQVVTIDCLAEAQGMCDEVNSVTVCYWKHLLNGSSSLLGHKISVRSIQNLVGCSHSLILQIK